MLVLLLALQAAVAEPNGSDLFAFLRPSVVVSADERRQLDRGEPIARVLPGGDGEIAVFAAVPVNIDGDRLVAWMRRIAELKKSSYVSAIGRFSDPPRIDDLADLALDADDLSEIRRCRPGVCGLKLSRAEIEQLGAIARAGADWKPLVQDAFRRLVLQRVQAYLSDGHAALDDYNDHAPSVSPAARFESLLQRSKFLGARLPGFAEHLERFPHRKAPQVESFVYWSKERLGRKPIVSATHVNILRGTDSAQPEVLVAGKEIFATHYVTASLGLTALVRGRSGSHSYLVYLNRSEVDVLGGRLGGIVRWFVERRLKPEASDVLRDLRQRLESGAPPGQRLGAGGTLAFPAARLAQGARKGRVSSREQGSGLLD